MRVADEKKRRKKSVEILTTGLDVAPAAGAGRVAIVAAHMPVVVPEAPNRAQKSDSNHRSAPQSIDTKHQDPKAYLAAGTGFLKFSSL